MRGLRRLPCLAAATSPLPDFGVVIPAKEEHLHWVRGTCASIRHFMGETPICVILDGERFPDELRRAYDVTVIRRDEVAPPELRDTFGSLRAKNAALWASPFERYLLLDADTVVWGDMRELVDYERFDFVLDDQGERARSVMDVEAVIGHVPDFDARRNAARFANTGAYFGRRGVLDLDRYVELMALSQSHPALFYGSQGLFNLMVLDAADRGEIRVGFRRLQVMTGRSRRGDVAGRFTFVGSRPAVTGSPVVLHWVGSPKPRVRETNGDHFLPMTFFRLEARRAARQDHRPRRTDPLQLRLEDALCTDWRGTNLRGRLGRLRRRSRQRWAAWRVALRSRVPDRMVDSLRRGSRPTD